MRQQMMRIKDSQSMQAARLDLSLEYAVVQSWDDLFPQATPGSVHIEYQTASDGSLDFLKIWASTVRGHWKLVAELWMKHLWSHSIGLTLGDDHNSAAFAHTLRLVMGHENAF